MKGIPGIKAVMTPFPYAIALDATVGEARRLMREHGIRHLPVVEGHTLVGVVTERDINLLGAAGLSAVDADRVSVRQVHTPEPYVVELEEPLDNVLATMAARHIGSALVTRKGRLAGVFTASDACRAYAEDLRARYRPAGGDDAA